MRDDQSQKIWEHPRSRGEIKSKGVLREPRKQTKRGTKGAKEGKGGPTDPHVLAKPADNM